MSRESINPRPPRPPLRSKTGSGAEPAGSGGVLKCACFHLPTSRSKKTKKKSAPPPLVTTKLISSTSRGSAAEAPVAAAQSPRVTFLASASLSTWWPSSPPSSAASAGGPTPAAPPATGNAAAPGRVSTSSASAAAARNGFPRATPSSPSSFSHWRRSLSSRRVSPHGATTSARPSFSFPTSPASASSSCMSTPKIPQGCQQ